MSGQPEDYSQLTPMMRQFFDLKGQVDDSILFFRMGDFYEIFGDDAEEVAPKLELVLTSRERGDKNRIPFCGVPHHSARNYWLKLLKMGYRVAIADQVESPEEAKGLVKRDIVQVFTPGCIEDLEGLDADTPNYLMAAYEDPEKRQWAMAVLDVSTGEFRCGPLESWDHLGSQIALFRPREVLVRRFLVQEFKTLFAHHIQEYGLTLGVLPEGALRDSEEQSKRLAKNFAAATTAALPCGEVVGADPLVAAVLCYLDSLKATTSQFLTIRSLSDSQAMTLDETACRDLEIFYTVRRGQVQGSLYHEINRTRTPMGARMLRSTLAAPLISADHIHQRQCDVKAFMAGGHEFLNHVRQSLKGVSDLERLSTRLLSGKISPPELAQIRETLRVSLDMVQLMESLQISPAFQDRSLSVIKGREALELLGTALEEFPGALGSLQVFVTGYHERLDSSKELALHGEDKIKQYEQQLRNSTGISSLKIKQHKTFGRLIEVTKANLSKVPTHFVRRQTMVNNERFVTEELLELDETLSSAMADALEQELQIFQSLLADLAAHKQVFQKVAGFVAYLDLVQGFAFYSRERSLVCPELSDEQSLTLTACRHPVVETFVGQHAFVPNDVLLSKKQRHLLITGPNMAGKSTVMRQTAIAAIMHQIGSHVAASDAKMPIFDRIFTRVGAADDLSRGQSTFMVEMSEAAAILRQATPNSLVILDEVGRGTSTQDGLAIASAILECLNNDVGCFSMFATHYHELVPLAEHLDKVANVQIEVHDKEGQIQFTHRLVSGASGSSFGIEVAKIAGLPSSVIARAKEFLQGHKVSIEHDTQGKKPFKKSKALPLEVQGLALEADESSLTARQKGIIERLETLNTNRLTPLQALNLLDQMKSELAQEKQEDIFSGATL